MRFGLLRLLWEAFEILNESIENWIRNLFGDINLTILSVITQLTSTVVFISLGAIPFAVFYYFGTVAGCISIVGALAMFSFLVASGTRTCPSCSATCSRRVIVCPLCNHEFRE